MERALVDPLHPALVALQQLRPNVLVAGGSFSKNLPDPASVHRTDRSDLFRAAQATAGDKCIADLLKSAGIPEQEVRSGDGGERLWPGGYVGSLTYKETVVLGALAPSRLFSMLGIDLETIDLGRTGLIESIISPDDLPSRTRTELAVTCAFSAKEAVFKAQYPATLRRLSFPEVRLSWLVSGGNRWEATAACPGGISLRVQCEIVDRWIVSAAHTEG